jgi:hypothetical protein
MYTDDSTFCSGWFLAVASVARDDGLTGQAADIVGLTSATSRTSARIWWRCACRHGPPVSADWLGGLVFGVQERKKDTIIFDCGPGLCRAVF